MEEVTVVKANWQPTWMVDTGHDCPVGIAMDDKCYVCLVPDGEGWKPTTHIPMQAAQLIGKLVSGL